jgi:hypothetical protein
MRDEMMVIIVYKRLWPGLVRPTVNRLPGVVHTTDYTGVDTDIRTFSSLEYTLCYELP